jgi:hypothetical protein
MTKITCVFRRTTEGRLALLFACDLLRLWTACGKPGPDPRLHVLLKPDPVSATRIASGDEGLDSVLSAERQRVLAEVCATTGLACEQVVVSGQEDSGDIFVDHVSALQRADLDVLYPSREKSLLARGRGPLLVPFGDSLSAQRAVTIALKIAEAMALPVVLYHTTWRDPGKSSTDPAKHMCEGARRVSAVLLAQAKAAGVKHSLVVECADDVAEGILQCALRLDAKLIVMPRSAKTTMGCYVNQALVKTPMPLLAVAAKREVA